MIVRRPSDQRGHADHGWLDTYHTFSFAGYHDPRYMGFRHLRVINEDRVQPGSGFDTHSHHDMEIITYVLEGSLEHQDSMGNRSVIVPGDVQRMSAGTGVTHSEYNPSSTEPVHLLQIWILPERKGLSPSYEQKRFPPEEKRHTLRLVASRGGREGAVTVHQQVDLFASLLEPGDRVTHRLRPDRHAWLQVVGGAVGLNGTILHAGDGAAVSDEERLEIAATEGSEILLFDLA
jgi:redox-sensitive bicupin YhaK (pirin superfamily)